MIRRLLELGSPAGARARLSVLIFHRVRAQPDALFPEELTAEGFAAVCGWLSRWFNVLPLDEAVERLRDGRLPARAAALSFDDGYADNHDVALPVLRRAGLPCTFFVSSGFIDGGRMWNDTVIEALRHTRAATLALDDVLPGVGTLPCSTAGERRAAAEQVIGHVKYLEPDERLARVESVARRAEVELPTDLMLTSAQLRALRKAGMQIGAHTVSHPILARLPAEQARHEIVEGRRHLEDVLGEAVSLFAYPNGKPDTDYQAETVALVREAGFRAAFSTAWGVARAGADLMQLPRFTPWERTPRRFALRMLHNMRPRVVQASVVAA
jgi:peptidoglycan/xylan/chitin deacetylase (PgdA/CDA1 family)